MSYNLSAGIHSLTLRCLGYPCVIVYLVGDFCKEMRDAHHAFLSRHFTGSNQLTTKGLPKPWGLKTEGHSHSGDSLKSCAVSWTGAGLWLHEKHIQCTWKYIQVREWNFSLNNLPWSSWDVRVLICATPLLHKSFPLKVRKTLLCF